jgi:hypothetical protein
MRKKRTMKKRMRKKRLRKTRLRTRRRMTRIMMMKTRIMRVRTQMTQDEDVYSGDEDNDIDISLWIKTMVRQENLPWVAGIYLMIERTKPTIEKSFVSYATFCIGISLCGHQFNCDGLLVGVSFWMPIAIMDDASCTS